MNGSRTIGWWHEWDHLQPLIDSVCNSLFSKVLAMGLKSGKQLCIFNCFKLPIGCWCLWQIITEFEAMTKLNINSSRGSLLPKITTSDVQVCYIIHILYLPSVQEQCINSIIKAFHPLHIYVTFMWNLSVFYWSIISDLHYSRPPHLV